MSIETGHLKLVRSAEHSRTVVFLHALRDRFGQGVARITRPVVDFVYPHLFEKPLHPAIEDHLEIRRKMGHIFSVHGGGGNALLRQNLMNGFEQRYDLRVTGNTLQVTPAEKIPFDKW